MGCNSFLSDSIVFNENRITLYKQADICDLLGVNYSLHNGLYCTNWVH